jgi:hypothetical protein
LAAPGHRHRIPKCPSVLFPLGKVRRT